MEVDESGEKVETMSGFELEKATSYFMKSFTKYNSLVKINKIDQSPVS
jgi:hypothetical protein